MFGAIKGFTMRLIICLILSLSFYASAETELRCWNSASNNTQPIFQAAIGTNLRLVSPIFDFRQSLFRDYFIDQKSEDGTRTEKGELVNYAIDLVPHIIENNRSPYKGNNEYSVILGSYKLVSTTHPVLNEDFIYKGRLILPANLSKEYLKTFTFKNRADQRVNAVMIMSPSHSLSSQSGDNYLKMFCASR
jgi:hypothetical protein